MEMFLTIKLKHRVILSYTRRIANSQKKKQGVTDNEKVTIKKSAEEIQIHSYILTFDRSIIPKKIKIGYYLKKVE